MRKNIILTTAILFLTLGMALTACGSSAKFTVTIPPAIQATATQHLAVQATATQPPAVQATATQPPAIQATATQPPSNTATVAPIAADGAALLNTRCTICHSLDRVTSTHKTADQWNQTVSRMITHGAQLTSEEQQVLVAYLAKTYGP